MEPTPPTVLTQGSEPPPCYLLKLPPELRNAIYELVVAYEEPIDLISLADPTDCGERCKGCVYPSLTRLGGQIGSEALSVFFATNHFAADVRWAPTGGKVQAHSSDPFGPPWYPEWPFSGIRGLGRACKRIGKRKCSILQHLTITWRWDGNGEASLKAMAAWAALWVDTPKNERCMPKPLVIKHEYVSRHEDGALIFDRHQPRSREFPLHSLEPLRTDLRLELMKIAEGLREPEGDADDKTMKGHIVEWVQDSSDKPTEPLKQYLRFRWQTKNRHGVFWHSSAHKILEANYRHLCPLYRLTPELRKKIYSFALPLESTKVHLTSASHQSLHREMDSPPPEQSLDANGTIVLSPLVRFTDTLPALLRLNHEISREALAVYFERTTFEARLEFSQIGIGQLKEFCREIRALKSTTPLGLHMEWIWPQPMYLNTLLSWQELFSPSGCELGTHVHLVTKPGDTVLTRLLIELMSALERLGRTHGRRYGQYAHKLRDRDPADVFNWIDLENWSRRAMVDWIMEHTNDRSKDVKEMCRDLLWREIDTLLTGRDERVEWLLPTLEGRAPIPPPPPPVFNPIFPPQPPLPMWIGPPPPPPPALGVPDSTGSGDEDDPGDVHYDGPNSFHPRDSLQPPILPSGYVDPLANMSTPAHVATNDNPISDLGIEELADEGPSAATDAGNTTEQDVLLDGMEIDAEQQRGSTSASVNAPNSEGQAGGSSSAEHAVAVGEQPVQDSIETDGLQNEDTMGDGGGGVNDDVPGLDSAAIFGDTLVPPKVLRHPKWLYKGCGYPFEESKSKLEDN